LSGGLIDAPCDDRRRYVGLVTGAYLADLDLRDVYPVGTMKALDFRYVCVEG